MQKQKGITLIALIITIIVMLILVGVTVTVALNGGLFNTTRQAKTDTQRAIDAEKTLSNGRVKIEDTWYDSMEDYVAGKESANQVDNMPSYRDAEKEGDYLAEKATYESDGYTAVIPIGFKISEEEGEQEIGTGLVIEDSKGNEFVWIPLKNDDNLVNLYKYNNTIYEEPKVLTDEDSTSQKVYDSQEQLDYYYGKNDDGTSYYTYDENAYATEYAEMIKQVNKYRGFYIGRYETTIDGERIGSKENKTVLTAGTKNENDKCYRWYGLYYESKNAYVTGNNKYIQTAMIYGQLWDKTMEFIREQNKVGKTSYNVDTDTPLWHQGSVLKNSGQANVGDVALNIWDLESNGAEWTQEANSSKSRVSRGGDNYGTTSYTASHRRSGLPNGDDLHNCSRLALYIKN